MAAGPPRRAYELPSPNGKALWALFHRFCEENGMLHTPEDCFACLHSLPEKYEQTCRYSAAPHARRQPSSKNFCTASRLAARSSRRWL